MRSAGWKAAALQSHRSALGRRAEAGVLCGWCGLCLWPAGRSPIPAGLALAGGQTGNLRRRWRADRAPATATQLAPMPMLRVCARSKGAPRARAAACGAARRTSLLRGLQGQERRIDARAHRALVCRGHALARRRIVARAVAQGAAAQLVLHLRGRGVAAERAFAHRRAARLPPAAQPLLRVAPAHSSCDGTQALRAIRL